MSDDLFTRPLELWRPGTTPDGMGGVTEGFAQVGDEPLLAKVDQPSTKDLRIGSATGATLTHSIYFDGAVDVRRGDELRDPGQETDEGGAAVPGAGKVYAVKSAVQPSEPDYTKALCEIRQTEEG